MTWVAVAIGGSAVIGAGASYLGSKKQADASREAAGISQQQYRQLRADQMPYMQAGYGGLGRLNTLLGINPRQRVAANDGQMTIPRAPGGGGYQPTASGGVRRVLQFDQGQGQRQQIPSQMRLQRLLALRAQNGDTEAARMLQQVG